MDTSENSLDGKLRDKLVTEYRSILCGRGLGSREEEQKYESLVKEHPALEPYLLEERRLKLLLAGWKEFAPGSGISVTRLYASSKK